MASKLFCGLLMLFALCYTTEALSCAVCDKSSCTLPECKGGRVPDPCGCCYVCAKQEHETCGGYVHGQCDMELSCVVQLERGKLVTGNEEGTCRPAVNVLGDTEYCKPTSYYGCNVVGHDCMCDTEIACSNPKQFQNIHLCKLHLAKEEELISDCAAKRCDIQPSPTCPDDSKVQPGYLPRGSCCPLPSKCVCDMKKCRAQVCHPSTEKVLINQGNDQPGSCCNVYECRPRENVVDCSRVNCASSTDVCPPDSEMVPANNERRECCGQNTVCKCRSQECSVPVCADGFRLQVLFRGDGNPGACCDVYKCSTESLVAGCALQGRQFQSGEVYELPDCRRCECKNGVSLCEPQLCPRLSCTRLTKFANECCAVCADDENVDPVNGVNVPYPLCRDGEQHYLIGDQWKPDNCTQCECMEGGKKRCKSAYCHGVEFTTTMPEMCPSFESCDLTEEDCPFGFQRDEQNCRKCACVPTQCPSFTDCKITCDGGFQIDGNNCPVCRCKSTKCKDMTSCSKQCPYGYKKYKNGCDKCRCRRCPLMDQCNKNCRSGLDHDRFGCTICKCKDTTDASNVPSVGGKACQDVEANQRRDDGEVWSSGCYICMCKGGNIMCDLLKCPLLTCDKPKIKNGDCCPSCVPDAKVSVVPPSLACKVPNGKWYLEGEIWDMENNSTCTCYDANMLCSSAWCPPAPCDKPVKAIGQRCPVCTERADGDNSETCLVGTKQYNIGESWKVSECETCACEESQQVKCFTMSCPHVFNCKQPVLRHGNCCPTCIETSPVRQFISPTRNTSCDIAGTLYGHGDKWEDKCHSCTCVQGHASCRVTQCLVVPDDCPRIRSTECCEVCDYTGDIGYAANSNWQTIIIATVLSLLVVVMVLAVGFGIRRRRHSQAKFQTKLSNPEGSSRPGYRNNSTKPLMSTSSEDATMDCVRAQHV